MSPLVRESCRWTPNRYANICEGEPFVPFRLVMVDGTSHVVLSPEYARILGRQLVLARGVVDGMPEQTVFCDPAHRQR